MDIGTKDLASVDIMQDMSDVLDAGVGQSKKHDS